MCPSTDDDVDEDDSTVTATINSGAGYAVGCAQLRERHRLRQ